MKSQMMKNRMKMYRRRRGHRRGRGMKSQMMKNRMKMMKKRDKMMNLTQN